MKTVTIPTRGRNRDGLHIEAPGCIINVRPGLHDTSGREITSIAITCDRTNAEDWHLPDVFSLRDVACILAELPAPLEPASPDEIEDFLRSKLNLTRGFNVRAQKIYNANGPRPQYVGTAEER